MKTQTELAEHFDRSRGHLRAVAFRMLGSVDEADDAIQETWLRADRAADEEIVNPTGWLTTILGRVCLDMLRARRRRGEDFTDMSDLEPVLADHGATDPEDEAVMADSVGLALLVVLDALGPDERVAFVLHDLFAVPFAQVAEIVERTPVTAKKLASRARRRVHGAPAVPAVDLARQREVVEAFLAASRTGDIEGLLAVLAPDVVRRITPAALRPELRGARPVAEETRTNVERARFARPALIDGIVGAVVAPRGRLLLVLQLTVADNRITDINVITDPAGLHALTIAALDVPGPLV